MTSPPRHGTGSAPSSLAADPASVETPIGVVDLARVRNNAARIVGYASKHGLGWRPHVKTHKSRLVASIQLEAGARGLTVATLREAEVMASLTSDLLLAYPPVGEAKLARLAELPGSVDLKVALDSSDVLRPLAEAARGAGRRVGVLVEEDVGMGRVGLASAAEVVELAQEAAGTEGVDFRGILFYPGQIRSEESTQGAPLAEVAGRVAKTLDALGAAGLTAEIVSGGSTPTLWRSHEIPGLTEIRSGSAIYFDREALEVGVATPDDVAYSVLATVVSTAVPGHAVVDAGSKALAKESRGGTAGFGFVQEHSDVIVSSVSEEHGVLHLGDSTWKPRVGERVHIVPNHVCVSVNLQDRVLVVDGGDHWLAPIDARGRAPADGEG